MLLLNDDFSVLLIHIKIFLFCNMILIQINGTTWNVRLEDFNVFNGIFYLFYLCYYVCYYIKSLLFLFCRHNGNCIYGKRIVQLDAIWDKQMICLILKFPTICSGLFLVLCLSLVRYLENALINIRKAKYWRFVKYSVQYCYVGSILVFRYVFPL